jgi:hypothetical protein
MSLFLLFFFWAPFWLQDICLTIKFVLHMIHQFIPLLDWISWFHNLFDVNYIFQLFVLFLRGLLPGAVFSRQYLTMLMIVPVWRSLRSIFDWYFHQPCLFCWNLQIGYQEETVFWYLSVSNITKSSNFFLKFSDRPFHSCEFSRFSFCLIESPLS